MRYKISRFKFCNRKCFMGTGVRCRAHVAQDLGVVAVRVHAVLPPRVDPRPPCAHDPWGIRLLDQTQGLL